MAQVARDILRRLLRLLALVGINLGKNFKNIFTYVQWKRLARDLRFNLHAQPTDLTFDQWLGLFTFFFSAMQRGQTKLPKQPSKNSGAQARRSRLPGEVDRGKNR
jgi:hypothetical protein